MLPLQDRTDLLLTELSSLIVHLLSSDGLTPNLEEFSCHGPRKEEEKANRMAVGREHRDVDDGVECLLCP